MWISLLLPVLSLTSFTQGQILDISDSASESGSARGQIFQEFNSEFLKNTEVKFYLYTKETFYDPEEAQTDGKQLFRNFTNGKEIKIIIHGWDDNLEGLFNTRMVRGFLDNKDCNVISVDWSRPNTFFYSTARKKAVTIAAHVAEFIDNLYIKHGVQLHNVHMIGFCLGAHIAGMAGQVLTRGKIGRITGLDPYSVLYKEQYNEEELSQESARFVDIIHTSSYLEGTGIPIGHADFYPNDPMNQQPGCNNDMCSHKRAYQYFVESLERGELFPALPCTSWTHFVKGQCDHRNPVFMGYSLMINDVDENYFLKTGEHPPFGQGII